MSATNVLAVAAVKDLTAAKKWYSDVLDRTPDEEPMEGMVEWNFEGGGVLQLYQDTKKAGNSSVTIIETNLDERRKDLEKKGIEVTANEEGGGYKIAVAKDPDGNSLVFAVKG